MNVQNALERSFRLSQEGYSVTSLQGFSNTIDHIGWDMEGFDVTCVIFGMRGVFSDRVGLDMGCGGRDRSGDRFLRKSEGKGLVDGFGGGDSRGGDEGDGNSGGIVRHGEGMNGKETR